jgi:hypothetical protein
VKKGEQGIRILAPVIEIRRKKDEEAEKDIRTQNQAVLVGFRAAYVFERLSRDLRPGFCALDVARDPPQGAGDGSHIIAQLNCPLQRLLAMVIMLPCVPCCYLQPAGVSRNIQSSTSSSAGGVSVIRRHSTCSVRRLT